MIPVLNIEEYIKEVVNKQISEWIIGMQFKPEEPEEPEEAEVLELEIKPTKKRGRPIGSKKQKV